MSVPAQSDLDSLAGVLARLLATWWQQKLRQTTDDKHSRAPPAMQAENSDSYVCSQTTAIPDSQE